MCESVCAWNHHSVTGKMIEKISNENKIFSSGHHSIKAHSLRLVLMRMGLPFPGPVTLISEC